MEVLIVIPPKESPGLLLVRVPSDGSLVCSCEFLTTCKWHPAALDEMGDVFLLCVVSGQYSIHVGLHAVTLDTLGASPPGVCAGGARIAETRCGEVPARP